MRADAPVAEDCREDEDAFHPCEAFADALAASRRRRDSRQIRPCRLAVRRFGRAPPARSEAGRSFSGSGQKRASRWTTICGAMRTAPRGNLVAGEIVRLGPQLRAMTQTGG